MQIKGLLSSSFLSCMFDGNTLRSNRMARPRRRKRRHLCEYPNTKQLWDRGRREFHAQRLLIIPWMRVFDECESCKLIDWVGRRPCDRRYHVRKMRAGTPLWRRQRFITRPCTRGNTFSAGECDVETRTVFTPKSRSGSVYTRGVRDAWSVQRILCYYRATGIMLCARHVSRHYNIHVWR